MEKMMIYHNSRCSKSRGALELIKEHAQEFTVIEYLKSPLTETELKRILKKLGIKAEVLIRKQEPLFKEKFIGKKFSEAEWIKILVKNPILMERPIIVKGNKAVIGRPAENIFTLFE